MRDMEKQGFDWPNFSRPFVLGHRGMGVGSDENTLEALTEAVRRGADGVELDVRSTADGALALHHDAEIDGLGPVSGLTVAQLPARVPLLEPVLDALSGSVVNIEIKNFPAEPGYDPEELTARRVVALLGERRGRDRVIVSSFSAATLDAVVAADADVTTGFLTTADYDQDRALARALERGWSALHPHFRALRADLVAAAHGHGLTVNTWTVNAPDQLAAATAMGVDAVISDDVSTALAVVAAAAGEGSAPED
jgi:glycerophosphoryl diester phosphodiesterase